MAISGASWVYVFKLDGVTFEIILFSAFAVSSLGIFTNVTKLSNSQKELKGLKNG